MTIVGNFSEEIEIKTELDKDKIILKFGKSIDWISLSQKQACALAEDLINLIYGYKPAYIPKQLGRGYVWYLQGGTGCNEYPVPSYALPKILFDKLSPENRRGSGAYYETFTQAMVDLMKVK